MARETLTEASGRVRVDLHGHPTSYILYDLVPAVLEAAWKRGCTHVTLIHGSPDITEPEYALTLGRGDTKWELRNCLNRGDFMDWAWYSGSVKHSGLEAHSGAMTLALRPNPNPEPDYSWPDLDEPEYDYEGPWHRARGR